MAFEWKDLIDGEDYITVEPINRIAGAVTSLEEDLNTKNAIYIGYIAYDDSGFVDGADVTETITYKPDFSEAWNSAFKPMAFSASHLGSGTGDGYIFHSHYCAWDYFSSSFELYFHAYTDDGELKVVKLVYQYDEADTSTPQSITAYIVEIEAGGVSKSYVDESIQSAILDSWEAEV